MTAKLLAKKIIGEFPEARSLDDIDQKELSDLWSVLPCLDVDGVKRLLPCLMLTVLKAEAGKISLTFADQLIYYLDGYESGLSKDLAMGVHKQRILRSFSQGQAILIRQWLEFIIDMKFADCARDQLVSALEYWQMVSQGMNRKGAGVDS
jgi:hypothetical protein